MSRVLTNCVGLQYAIEESVGVLPVSPEWFTLEPNSFGTLGATITTVARDPISRNRQRRKGTITDLDSAADFEADLTLSHFMNFAEGFVFAQFQGAEVFDPDSVDADSYTVQAGSTLTAGSLVYGRGFDSVANNGLKVVDTGATATDIPIVGAGLTIETAPDKATVDVAGFRSAAGDLEVTVVGASQVTITSTAGIFDDPGLDIQPGSSLYFSGFTLTENSGFVRVVSVDPNTLVVDKTGQTWTTNVGNSDVVDMLVGRFLKNVDKDDPLFLEQSYTFEVAYPDLIGDPIPTSDGYEYSKGNYSNTLGISLPLTDKSTMSFAFIGTDTEPPVDEGSRATNAANAITPTMTAAFNTTQDIARLRITDVDETGLTTDFKSVTLNMNNNVSPEKVLGTLGAKYMNYGNFEIDLESQVIFTSPAVVSAIRNNTTLTMDFVLENDDGAIYVDIPSMTLGGGGKDFPVNESVLINLSGTAFIDDVLESSIGITAFAYIPEA